MKSEVGSRRSDAAKIPAVIGYPLLVNRDPASLTSDLRPSASRSWDSRGAPPLTEACF
jgi:hypothetical protein